MNEDYKVWVEYDPSGSSTHWYVRAWFVLRHPMFDPINGNLKETFDTYGNAFLSGFGAKRYAKRLKRKFYKAWAFNNPPEISEDNPSIPTRRLPS